MTLGAALRLALAIVFIANASQAQEDDNYNRTAARHLALEGSELYDAGQYDQARDRFHRAYELYEAPTLSLWLGHSLRQLGRWKEAEEWYVTTAAWQLAPDAPPAFREAVSEAESTLTKLRAKMPKLRVVVAGAKPEQLVVTLDGVELPRALLGVHQPVDPGPHALEARANGRLVAREAVDLTAFEQRDVALDASLRASTPPPSATLEAQADPVQADSEPKHRFDWRTPSLVGAFAVGGVGVGVGIWKGLSATQAHNRLENDVCDGNLCPSDELEDFRSARTASTVGYIAGAIGVGTGVGLLLLTEPAPAEQETAWIEPWLGYKAAGFSGRF